MIYGDFCETKEKLENHLYCVGTIYDSFEALLEVLGKLNLEEPLYLVYLAQKSFAQAVITAAQKNNKQVKLPFDSIKLNPKYHQSVN